MLSPAFLYLDPVHAFLSNKFSYNTVLIRFILGSENLQRFPITYWTEYICLARPYIIWLQPAFPGSSFTSLFFSQSSPFVLLRGGSLPSRLCQCCSQNCLFCPFFCISQERRTWGDCPWFSVPGIPPWNTMQSIPATLPRLIDHPPGQVSKSRTGRYPAEKCLLCWYRPTTFPVILLGNNNIISCLSYQFSERFLKNFWDLRLMIW